MPCKSCLESLERGGHSVYELVHFKPEILPALPTEPLTDWRQVGELLVQLAGALRLEHARQNRE